MATPRIKVSKAKSKIKDIAGKKFNRLTALYYVGPLPDKRSAWMFECECGVRKEIAAIAVTTGNTKSCGCLGREVTAEKGRAKRTHGMSRTSLYNIWNKMIKRCRDPRDPAYDRYGGRGITVCERWNSFTNFVEDMGERPDGYSLERERNNEGYNPDNCKWATNKEQSNNRRSNVILVYNGVSKNITQWAEEIGISKGTLWTRLSNGWSVKDAIEQPRDSRPLSKRKAS